MKNSNSVYKYVLVGQELSEKLRGQRMRRCVFCRNEWQGNRHGAARHFRSVKGCSQVTNEALMDMHYTSGYAFEGGWLERIRKYEELHGPWVDERRTGGGLAQVRVASNAPVGARQQGNDVIDLDGEGEDCGAGGVEGEVEALYSQGPDKLPDGEGCSNLGKRKGVVGATLQQGKKMRQSAIKEVFGFDWVAQHRKLWLRFVYNNQFPFNIFRSPTWKARESQSRHLGLLYTCETRFASVYAMLERLDVVRRPLERMLDGTDWCREPWATTSIRQHARWVRWQIRHGSWWDSMDILRAVMKPAYDLLRKMDRGGLCMFRVVEWAGRLATKVEAAVAPLEDGLVDQIFRCMQERVAHICEHAHATAYLLCPMRRSMQYYSSVVMEEDRRLVREAERYILSQTGFDERRKEYRDAVMQLRDFHMHTLTCAWGGEQARAATEMCVGE
ncbi:hypothetical protein CBR_g60005 [Chara braunii]|uniref:Uncharacterized protein n=1 Tax=Chara braunii TaxID=69332 RepID=A0A388K8F7_CHABU|nr:hypothetical protein CBR_g60005 [Chara braunii]|eukprot:GBG66354.1 hypothetical protein CBR_g60005 [Chara braunii]